jgi:membrane protein DedA with SNARE-associated domain
MNCMTGLLVSFGLYLSSGTAIAATPEEGNRASMLSIILVAAVMIVVVKLVVAFAKRKMEADLRAAREELGSGAQKNDSQPNG